MAVDLAQVTVGVQDSLKTIAGKAPRLPEPLVLVASTSPAGDRTRLRARERDQARTLAVGYDNAPMSIRERWRGPTIHAPAGQSATFVELFFDLVFVFAMTEITGFVGHHLDAEGVFRSVVIFWMIWWGWTQWTWALNPADTERAIVRVGTLAATAIAFLMAVSVAGAFDDDSGGLWFIAPYVAVRVLGLGLYGWVALERAEHFQAVGVFAVLSAVGLLVAVAGGFLEPEVRQWTWLAVIALDLTAAGVAGRLAGWHLHAPHFAERHGLIVIIALGESLIVAAAAVAGSEKTNDLMLVAGGAVAVTCLMWWTYFGWFKDGLEARLAGIASADQGHFARDAYSLLHFVLVCGIVGVAVAFEEMAAHPGKALDGEVIGALAVGMLLFLGASALAWLLAWRRVLWARIAVPAVLIGVFAIVRDAEAVVVVALAAAGLVVVVAIEEWLGTGEDVASHPVAEHSH